METREVSTSVYDRWSRSRSKHALILAIKVDTSGIHAYIVVFKIPVLVGLNRRRAGGPLHEEYNSSLAIELKGAPLLAGVARSGDVDMRSESESSSIVSRTSPKGEAPCSVAKARAFNSADKSSAPHGHCVTSTFRMFSEVIAGPRA